MINMNSNFSGFWGFGVLGFWGFGLGRREGTLAVVVVSHGLKIRHARVGAAQGVSPHARVLGQIEPPAMGQGDLIQPVHQGQRAFVHGKIQRQCVAFHGKGETALLWSHAFQHRKE